MGLIPSCTDLISLGVLMTLNSFMAIFFDLSKFNLSGTEPQPKKQTLLQTIGNNGPSVKFNAWAEFQRFRE